MADDWVAFARVQADRITFTRKLVCVFDEAAPVRRNSRPIAAMLRARRKPRGGLQLYIASRTACCVPVQQR
jgi:hypothetical protein